VASRANKVKFKVSSNCDGSVIISSSQHGLQLAYILIQLTPTLVTAELACPVLAGRNHNGRLINRITLLAQIVLIDARCSSLSVEAADYEYCNLLLQLTT
jgi:hypothetical protein